MPSSCQVPFFLRVWRKIFFKKINCRIFNQSNKNNEHIFSRRCFFHSSCFFYLAYNFFIWILFSSSLFFSDQFSLFQLSFFLCHYTLKSIAFFHFMLFQSRNNSITSYINNNKWVCCICWLMSAYAHHMIQITT